MQARDELVGMARKEMEATVKRVEEIQVSWWTYADAYGWNQGTKQTRSHTSPPARSPHHDRHAERPHDRDPQFQSARQEQKRTTRSCDRGTQTEFEDVGYRGRAGFWQVVSASAAS